MRPLAKVCELTGTEPRREALDLHKRAGNFEVIEGVVKVTGSTELRHEGARKALHDYIAVMPDDELRKQIWSLRRSVAEGQSRYGVFDPDTDRRDMLVEGLQEACDLVFYLTALVHRKGSPMAERWLRVAMALYREMLDEAHTKGAI